MKFKIGTAPSEKKLLENVRGLTLTLDGNVITITHAEP